MCEPTTLTAVAPFLFAAGAGAGAIGAYQNAKTEKAMAKYNSRVAANEAVAKEKAAADIKAKGIEAASEHLRQVRLLKGKQTAAMAASGILISDGSALDILESTDFFGGQDAQRIAHNANMQGWQLDAEATTARGNAAMYKAAGKAIKPFQSAGLSLLGSAGTYGMAKMV